jgi:uncharacterized membrane-anchored protein
MNSRDAIKRALTTLALACLVLATPLALAAPEKARSTQGAPAAASAEAATPEPAVGAEPATPSPWRQGPTQVDLGHDIDLALTERHAFLPKEQANKVLEANGSFHNDDVLGIVAPADHGTDWFVVIQYEAEGYVKDDESIDADELLKDLREGNDAANEERKEKGFSVLNLDGWSDPPHYDKAQHHLVWALIVSDPEGKSVNHNTRILGRRGFVSLTLVTDPSKLATFKPEAAALLGGTQFRSGARYADFDSSKDKVAEYGLAGLVAAGAGLSAAKLIKIGLFAKFWKLILVGIMAGKKFIVLGLIALGALVKKWMDRSRGVETGPRA